MVKIIYKKQIDTQKFLKKYSTKIYIYFSSYYLFSVKLQKNKHIIEK